MSRKKLILISGYALVLVVGFLGFRIYNNLYYLTFVDKIEHLETNEVYALFKHDYIFANPNFYVLRFDEKIIPEDLSYKSTYNDNRTQEEFNQMMDKVILENYEEDGSRATNPKIKILENRFLVMERGGYNFSLFDIQENKPIINNCCPFSSWESQNIWAENGSNYKGEIEKNEKSDYGIWIENNIHKLILSYIKENKSAKDEVSKNVTELQKSISENEIFDAENITALFLAPDSLEIIALKNELGEDFYTVADDNNYYNSNAIEFLDSNNFKYSSTDLRYIKYKLNNKGTLIIDTDELDMIWCLLLFDGSNPPKMSSSIDIATDIKKLKHLPTKL